MPAAQGALVAFHGLPRDVADDVLDRARRHSLRATPGDRPAA